MTLPELNDVVDRPQATDAQPTPTERASGELRISVIGCGYLGAVHAAVHGGARSRRRRHRRRRAQGRGARRAATPRSTSPGCPSCWPRRWRPAGCGSPRDIADAGGADGALRLRRHPAEARGERGRPRATSTPRSTALLPHLAPGDVVVGKSTVPVGTAERLAEQMAEAEPTATLAWNPEFLREGHAVKDTCSPDRLVYGVPDGDRAASARRPCSTRSTRAAGRGHPAHRHRLRHRPAGQGRGQLLPGHQDLVHQRDGRALRGDRRRRHAAGRRDRPRRPDRPPVPQRRPRLRRRLPAQGHPGLHGPRRRARRRPGADLPARGRLDQHAPPGAHGRPGPRGVRRLDRRARGSPSSAPRSSPTATTSATRRR